MSTSSLGGLNDSLPISWSMNRHLHQILHLLGGGSDCSCDFAGACKHARLE